MNERETPQSAEQFSASAERAPEQQEKDRQIRIKQLDANIRDHLEHGSDRPLTSFAVDDIKGEEVVRVGYTSNPNQINIKFLDGGLTAKQKTPKGFDFEDGTSFMLASDDAFLKTISEFGEVEFKSDGLMDFDTTEKVVLKLLELAKVQEEKK